MNPPYVEYSKVKKEYQLYGYETIESGNLYAYVIERSLNLMHENSTIGMITQMSGYCTPRMKSYQNYLFNRTSFNYISFFDDRPGKLFDIEDIRVAILLASKGNTTINNTFTTRYNKFKTEARENVFTNLSYFPGTSSKHEGIVLKIDSPISNSISEKIWGHKRNIGSYFSTLKNDNYVYYGYGFRYFGKILNHVSAFISETGARSTGDKYLYFMPPYAREIFSAIMNSTLFYWHYVNYSDGHNFTKNVIAAFPFTYPEEEIRDKLLRLSNELMTDLKKNATMKGTNRKTTGYVEYEEYHPKKSKAIIDKIDAVLAEYYGFTQEELDYIINYDIRFRMGLDANDDDGE